MDTARARSPKLCTQRQDRESYQAHIKEKLSLKNARELVRRGAMDHQREVLLTTSHRRYRQAVYQLKRRSDQPIRVW